MRRISIGLTRRLLLALAMCCSTALAGEPAPMRNPFPQAKDFFGGGISWVGKGVVVGATRDDIGTALSDAGLAFLFNGDPSSSGFGGPIKFLVSPEPSVGAEFGQSSAAFGTRVVIGAPFGGRVFPRPGAAYMYDVMLTSPTFGRFIHKFANPRPGPGLDEFGFDVANVGGHLVVGAYRDGTTAPAAGAAYLFDADASSPGFGSLLHTFENPTPQNEEYFGVNLAAVGSTRVLIGAFRDNASGPKAGAAYLFNADPSSPELGRLIATFANPNPVPSDASGRNDEFGHTIASAAGLAMISAFRADRGTTDSGVVYLYDVDESSPTFGELLLEIPNPTPSFAENFGQALAAEDGRGYIGAWWAHDQAPFSGAVYVVDLERGSATFGEILDVLLNPSAQSYALFGNSIAVRNGVVAVGSMNDAGTGAAYLFDMAR